MTALKDYITMRLSELEDSLAPLREQHAELARKIASIEREIVDLQNAGKAIGIVNGLPRAPLGVSRREPAQVTIKDAILAILQEKPEGLIALDILARINERFGWRLIRTSLSPQLTRLKRAGKITNHGSVWVLTTDPELLLP